MSMNAQIQGDIHRAYQFASSFNPAIPLSDHRSADARIRLSLDFTDGKEDK